METQNEKLLEFKINVKELATKLATQTKVKTYKEYWDIIVDEMLYPFYDEEVFYTVFQKTKDNVYGLHEYEIVERVWDNLSEKIYKVDPKRKLFRTREDAEEYINELIK